MHTLRSALRFHAPCQTTLESIVNKTVADGQHTHVATEQLNQDLIETSSPHFVCPSVDQFVDKEYLNRL